MKDTVQDGGSVLTTGYHEGLRKQLAVCGCLHAKPSTAVQVLTLTVVTDTGEKLVKGFHSHSAVC